MIGDFMPEDMYDASDPPHIRLLVISKIVEALDGDFDLARRAQRRADVIRLLRVVAQDIADG